MEGTWRGRAGIVAVLVAGALSAASTGCGAGSDAGGTAPRTIGTESPLRTFAPLLELSAREPWSPLSARWFVERSTLWFARDEGCEHLKVAVGHTLAEQRTPEFDWIYISALGASKGFAYYRKHAGRDCEHSELRFYTDQLTRPHDPGVRPIGLDAGEGFYLDLVDGARAGPRSGAISRRPAPVYAERIDEGDGGVRLAYWMLYGMHGEPGRAGAREGDWERVDVVLRDVGDDRYEPLAVQAGAERSIDWGSVTRVATTHPVVRVEEATHDATFPVREARCVDCVAWKAWRSLVEARQQPWYGFGGAWGKSGATDATTGPLGPHRYFPSTAERERKREEQIRARLMRIRQ